MVRFNLSRAARLAAGVALLSLSLAACAPPRGTGSPTGPASPQTGSAPFDRTLSTAIRVEPDSLATRPILSGAFASFALARRLFNAELTLTNDRGIPTPYLAEALPQLNTESWRVFPDGRMETTWKLKPGIAWHDGAPLSAHDFVLAWRVYGTPEFGAASSQSIRTIQEVAAPDDRSVLIQWRRPYPYADDLSGIDGLPPLPRQILEQAFQQGDPGFFARSPFWTREYVGLGPYRLEQWEPGSYLQGTAFSEHVLGRAKITRLRVNIITDTNTALANLLARDLDMAVDNAINLEQAVELSREWAKRGAGSVLYSSLTWQATAFQLRPELASPQSLLDVRVRRALAHAVDKQGFANALYHGEIDTADFIVSPRSKWGPAIDGAVQKYPHDVRRADQLMSEAGFAKTADGFFARAAEGRFKAELKIVSGREQEVAIMASDWRRAGFDIQEAILPAALSIDPASRVTFPAMFTAISGQGERTLPNYTTAQIPRADNNWRTGGNRGGWSNPEYDRLLDAFNITLDPKERALQVAGMARAFTEDVPVISLLFPGIPYAHVAEVRGVMPVAPEGLISWNVHEWELREGAR
jgi:peptide/nickel transport system substrate-binding protein